MNTEKAIFKRGSTTYYFSSIFFPKKVRSDVFALYSFVRTADDFVDKIPAKPKELLRLEQLYLSAIADPAFMFEHSSEDDISVRVVKNIVYLSKKYKFEPKWVTAFFDSMKQDIKPKKHQTIDESLQYVYGSADVIGLMMAKILQLPEKALSPAKKQGTAMQWINFIRDIDEDNSLNRLYFPLEDLKKFGLADLSKKSVQKYEENFKLFVRFEISRYDRWQRQADKGMQYIPYRLRIPLSAANRMYAWTARQIECNPMVIFEQKVKPSKYRVFFAIVASMLNSTR